MILGLCIPICHFYDIENKSKKRSAKRSRELSVEAFPGGTTPDFRMEKIPECFNALKCERSESLRAKSSAKQFIYSFIC